MSKPNWLKGLVLPGLAVILGLYYFTMEPNRLVDEHFTNGLSRWILTGIASITDLVSFSVAEIFIGLTLLGLLFGLFRFLSALLKGQGRMAAMLAVTNKGAVLFIVFLLFWGFNYRAIGLQAMLDLPPRQGSAQELKALAIELAGDAASERKRSGTAESEVFAYTGDLQEAAASAYQGLSLIYPQAGRPVGRAKPLLSSELFSSLGIAGIFIPYTAEANYNAHQPMLMIPSVVLHELAHLKGFAREEEASFMAYLASRSSEDPGVRYSATMMALFNTTKQLAELDLQSARDIRSFYSDGMRLDVTNYRAYWNSYSGVIQDRADEFNDLYLKSNGQSEGVESYGNMVSFLLAWKSGKPNN